MPSGKALLERLFPFVVFAALLLGGCAKQRDRQFDPPADHFSSGQGKGDAGRGERSASSRNIVITRTMQEIELLSRRGTAALRAENYNTAERSFQEVIRLDPKNPLRYRWLAMAYEGQGRTREAYDAWTKALNGATNGRSSDQSDTYILARYGELCLQVGDQASAAKAFVKASREVKKLYDAPMERAPAARISQQYTPRALAHYNAGVQMLLGGQHKKAEAELGLAVKLAPRWPMAKIARASELHRQRRMDEAERLFEEVRTSGAGEASKFAATKMRHFGLDRNVVTVIHRRPDGKKDVLRLTRAEYERWKQVERDRSPKADSDSVAGN